MSIWEIILIGVSLAMDAFALTIANCATYKNSLTKSKEWSMPVCFAIFQFLMPVIGYLLGKLFATLLVALIGNGFENLIGAIGGYLAFAVFLILAIKIVVDNLKECDGEVCPVNAPFKPSILIIQAVATSIDALIIGIVYSLNPEFLAIPHSLIIGGVTFVIVVGALYIGKSLGKALGKYATWAGAVILFVLAVKNLIFAII